jgi:myosin-1
MHIVVSTMVDGRLNTSLERKIQLVTIRGLSLSNYRDDWMASAVTLCILCFSDDFVLQAINVTVCEEGDPIIVVPFKTELIQVLMSLTNGAISVNIGPT